MRKARHIATSPDEREWDQDQDWKGKGKRHAIPDLGQSQILAIQVAPDEPSVRHAMKTSVSMPNLREEFHRTSPATSGGGEGRAGESVLAGQTLCDTFIFPWPHFQVLTISLPLMPDNTPQQTWSSSQPSSGPPRPTVRPRANSLRWLRRKP